MAAELQEFPRYTTHAKGYGANSAKVKRKGLGTLIGWHAIGDYLGVHHVTAWHWCKRMQLPVCRLPDGRVMTTYSLIDQWVMARREAQSQPQSLQGQTGRAEPAHDNGHELQRLPDDAEQGQQGREQAQDTCEPICVDAAPIEQKASEGAGSSVV